MPMKILLASLVLVALAAPGSAQNVDLEYFERSVRPVLATNCVKCHGPKKQRGELRVDHIEFLLEGGSRGPAIVRGKPDESLLLTAVGYHDVDLLMPPKGKLAAHEIKSLETWIRAKAPWPEEPRPSDGPGEEFDLWKRRAAHWSWQPIRRVVPPGPSGRHPIDAFVHARLEAAGLRPAPPASPRTLLRRAAFDLTGLPPAPADVNAFLADAGADAFERAVDRLLTSPHFGERWARHWMDLVRFAESYGHEFDYPIHHAWQYRDYLIRAFNADVPYDQFLREHVAGDLLKHPRVHPKDGFSESIIATGFWYLGQATHAPVDIRNDEAERVDNQIDVFSKTFLGLTVSCARCHDHKFDAISTEDYYALAGFLQSTRRQHAFLDARGRITAATEEITALRTEGNDLIQKQVAHPVERVADYALAAQDVVAALPARGSTIEAEKLPRRELTRGHFSRQRLSDDRWTGRHHMWWRGARPGDRLGIGIPVERAGRFELTVAFTRARDYGIVRVRLGEKTLLEDLDLYAKRLSPTGPLSLGVHELGAGEHRLTFEITGAHAKAVKSHMVGIDWVRLSPPEDLYETTRRSLVSRRADRDGLSRDHLERWVTALETPEARKPDHPASAIARAGTTDFARRWADLRREVARPEAARAGDVVFADFSGETFGDWIATGHAFGERPTRAGDWDPHGDGVRLTTPGVAHSGLASPRHQGALRSPTFTIEKKHILYRVRGRGTKIRVIIDSYVMDVYNALLFRGVSFDVNSDEWRWHDQRGDLGKFIGHRAHLEILDEGDGWVAVDEIRFSDHGAPPARPHEFTRALATDAALTTRDAVARAWAALLGDALAATRKGTAGADQVAAASWMLTHGLLPETESGELASLRRELATKAKRVPRPTKVIAAQDGSGEDEYVFIRGSHKNRGPMARRRFLEALGGKENAPIKKGSGRLQLAERMLDPQNPLPARVIVNRVWHHLFGRGLVPTPDDFGDMGVPPTHPELLDWLADWFRTEGGWSIKRLIKLIVTSETWQMSSQPADAAAEQRDPTNELWHRMPLRRLQGELIRDAMLAISGRLDRKMFGPSVDVHLTPFMTGRGRPRSGPLDGKGRRSLYVKVLRNFLSPMMLAFDTPLPFSTVGKRSVSNVPAQGLTLMNDPFVAQQAKLWAKRILADSPKPAARVRAIYVAAFAREPSVRESERALAFVRQQAATHGVAADAPSHLESWADLCHVVFNTKEFIFSN